MMGPAEQGDYVWWPQRTPDAFYGIYVLCQSTQYALIPWDQFKVRGGLGNRRSSGHKSGVLCESFKRPMWKLQAQFYTDSITGFKPSAAKRADAFSLGLIDLFSPYLEPSRNNLIHLTDLEVLAVVLLYESIYKSEGG